MTEIKGSASEQTVFVGEGVQFKGELTVPGLASINGSFEGALTAKGLIVGATGKVSGQIRVETAEVLGSVDDHLEVQSKLVLRASGSISGSVSYTKITVEEGGVLKGQLEKLDPQAPVASSDSVQKAAE